MLYMSIASMLGTAVTSGQKPARDGPPKKRDVPARAWPRAETYILRQEQTEDILAFGGVSRDTEANQESYWSGRIYEGVRRRIGWLLLLFIAGTLTSSVSHFFKGVQLALPD